MQTLPNTERRPFGTQFLPVSGTLTDRLLVSYRVDAERLARLVPAPLELTTCGRYGFLSVCAVEIADMGIVGSPGPLRWRNRELLYRVAARVRGEATFITLRSDVSSRALAVLGRHFSQFRPQLGQIELKRDASRLCMTAVTRDGLGDATVEADLEQPPSVPSVFRSQEAAAERLLGMTMAADVVRGRVLVQPIWHGPWQPRLVATLRARFAFVEAMERRLDTPFELDSTLAVRNVPHIWRAARWL